VTSIDDETAKQLFDAHGGDMDAIARAMGRLPGEFDEIEPDVPCEPVYVAESRTRPEKLGRPSLRKHILSVRHAFEPGWPRADKERIERARKSYDAGWSEMFQARDGNWVIQYCVRRRKRATPRNWFASELAA